MWNQSRILDKWNQSDHTDQEVEMYVTSIRHKTACECNTSPCCCVKQEEVSVPALDPLLNLSIHLFV